MTPTGALFQTKSPLVLASASPRRHNFLQELGLLFTVAAVDIDETVAIGEPAADFVLRMAREKAAVATIDQPPDTWILAADTVVVLDRRILGKPADAFEARTILLNLSDRWHEVWTGFALFNRHHDIHTSKAVKTDVLFMKLSPALCDSYIATGESLDKAGAYGIQGHGGFMVKQLTGSYSNVVGLPIAEVVETMLELGIITPAAV